MSTRRPLQPLSPPSANVLKTRYAYITTKSTNDHVAMQAQTQDDMFDLASDVSNLSALENEADDFEKRMIQTARDERRLNEARSGRVQAFRKARTHPRVGLTMDNLERNNARNDATLDTAAHVKFESPPSSNGSARSDPAIHAPPGWGRKSRTNRNWMRTIRYDEVQEDDQEQQQQRTPVPADDTIDRLYHDQYHQHTPDDTAPRRSIEDSPLSHKSSIQGTPRNDRSAEWDLTFELNEASIIASTPYIPRNTALDEIRQREIESLKDQAVRVDRTKGSSVGLARRPQSASANIGNNTYNVEQAGEHSPSEKKLRTRTNSWQSIGKSQPVTGTDKETSPVTVYKQPIESVEVAHNDGVNATRKSPQRPVRHRREDSQDLLRRLARASNTPSPGRITGLRPQTAPASQPSLSSQKNALDTPHVGPERNDTPMLEDPVSKSTIKTAPAPLNMQLQQGKLQAPQEPPNPALETAEEIDVTPMPVERTILNPKTPVVTGAWIDTPGPRTAHKTLNTSRSPAQSLKKSSPRKSKAQEITSQDTAEDKPVNAVISTIRPQLPGSALHALVQEAKADGRRQSADYGESTINSLEELISSAPEGEIDEDTLQGLQLPTVTPRNEAERLRQQELLHLHRMNDRLRAARTSIRDVSRGIKRVEDQVEHSDELGHNGGADTAVRECPCVTKGSHNFSLWEWWKSLYWDPSLKTKRAETKWRMWGGLTGISIFIITLVTYWIGEEIAWYVLPSYRDYVHMLTCLK